MEATRKIYYEKKAYRIVKKYVRKIVSKIPIDNATALTARPTVFLNFDRKLVEQMFLEIYTKIGKMEGQRITQDLKREKNFFDLFDAEFLTWFTQNIAKNIVSVSDTLMDEIAKVMEQAYSDNVTVVEAQNRIFKLVNSPNFYKWQALRIARTESTTASNYATFIAGRSSNLVLQKEWVTNLDSRTRNVEDEFDHWHMNGVVVDYEQPFNVNGDFVMYPGDPIGASGNIINCRCSLNLVPKRDSNGKLILRNNGN